MQDEEPQFLNPGARIEQHENRLPHWEQDGATFFVTFHLGDSISAERMNQWLAERDAWLRWNPPPWKPEQEREYLERFAHTVERWLDQMHGACILRRPEVASIVGGALAHFEGQRHKHHSWVVMPNHVHLMFSLIGGWKLDELLKSWKGFTAREINRASGRNGALWQKDYFDRMVRDTGHFWNCARYIRNNPIKACLKPGEYLLYESDFVRNVQL